MQTTPSYPTVPDVRKIAVVRANAIGDYIFSLPALDALRAAYPQSEIVLLGRAWHAGFLRNRPGPVDRAVVIPPLRGVSESDDHEVHADPAALEDFFAAMREEHFDLALQMHGGGKYSNPFARKLGARVTAGLRAPDAAPLDRWLPYVYFQPEVIRYLDVVSLVGARPVRLEPRLAVTPADLAESMSVVPDVGRLLVVVHPGASDPRRHWPTEKFAAVGDALAAAGAQIAVIGAMQHEERLVDGVIRQMKWPALNLYRRLSLGGLAGLLSRCDLMVADDSGPLHIAEAVGARTVGIYWCGNLLTAGPLTRTRHRPLASWRLDCPVCGRNTLSDPCSHIVSYVADVPVEEVLTSAFDLLEARTPADQLAPSAYAV